jgi:hypothetical protein
MIARHYGVECMPRIKATTVKEIRSFMPKFLQEVSGGVQSETRHDGDSWMMATGFAFAPIR